MNLVVYTKLETDSPGNVTPFVIAFTIILFNSVYTL